MNSSDTAEFQSSTVQPSTVQSSSYSASVAALRQYLETARQGGLNITGILSSLNVDADLLQDNTQRLSLTQFETIVARLIEQVDDPLFGLHTSAYIEPAYYSVHGYLLLNCATLREAVSTIPLYEKIVGDMGVSDVVRQGNKTLLRWRCQLLDAAVQQHVRENILASWRRFTAQYLKVEENPAAVWFEHSAPQNAEALQEYESLFGCPVLFDQAYTGVWINDAYLDQRIVQADEKLLQLLQDHATSLLHELEKSLTMSDQIKGMLRLMINSRIPSSELIADKLGISVRTMQRKLGEENTSYKAVLNGLRQELALHYVNNSSLTFDVIASKVGFSETRSFYRSFKQWTGKTANQVREENKAGSSV